MEIYSTIDPKLLTHKIIRFKDLEHQSERVDHSQNYQLLQVSTINAKRGRLYKPHYHLLTEKRTSGTQEMWMIVKGKVTIQCYDIDNTLITEIILSRGDAAITFNGGHSYIINSSNAIIYESKTGPYLGNEYDKKYIETE